MDPITQGALGAAVAQGLLGEKKSSPRVWLYGAMGGMAADLDVLIRSSADPLLAIEYHRHFTHSLPFAPIGGLLVALPFLFTRKDGRFVLRDGAKLIFLAALFGYFTHGLLDVFTSYGTMLLWPFTDARYAWDSISIVDPIVTVPLIVGVVLSRRRQHHKYARAALVFMALYFGLGAYQHHRALHVQQQVAASRGHTGIEGRCMPNLATLTRWRSAYKHQGTLYVDAVTTPWTADAAVKAGQSAPLVNELPENPAAFARWFHFADGYVSWHEDDRGRWLGDERYGVRPEQINPMWGMRVLQDGSVEQVRQTPDMSETTDALLGD